MRISEVRLHVASDGNYVMLEIARAFAAGFSGCGLAAGVAIDEALSESREGLLQIVVAPHEYYPLFLERHLSSREVMDANRRVHVLNVEQPGSPWYALALRYAQTARGVLDINGSAAADLEARGIACTHAPLGFDPTVFGAPETEPQSGRPIDVAFLGSHSLRREAFLSRHSDFFSDHACHLSLARLESPRRVDTPGFVAGQGRRDLLRTAKILLNIHWSETPYFEWHRALIAISSGCLVVSEPSGDLWPLLSGEHVVIAGRDELPGVCERYIADEAARARMAVRARERVLSCLQPAAICSRVVTTLESRRDDAIRNATAFMNRSLYAAYRAKESLRAQAQRVRSAARPRPDAAAQAVPEPADRKEPRRAEANRELGPEAWVELQNRVPERSPAVSVVITLFNYGSFIGECLRSVVASRIDAGYEVLVVDDGSTDAGPAIVRDEMARSEVPIRLIRKLQNTGLADSRNLGVRLSRAPWILMLDADNWIYPRCLEVLASAMRRSPRAAVYGMIKKFDRLGNACGLGSFYPWDERELVREPYLDAMALLDKKAILSVGGYSTEHQWQGWEDYDLWLKLASAERSAALVPEILSGYRVHAASMIHETNRHTLELARYFRRKFDSLVRRHPELDRLFGFPRADVEARDELKATVA